MTATLLVSIIRTNMQLESLSMSLASERRQTWWLTKSPP